MMSPVFPQEIIDKILDFLPDNPVGHKALKSSSLVCHSFLHTTRARLFRRIDLRDSATAPTKLDILLQRAPHLVPYIQVLRIIREMPRIGPVGLFAGSSDVPTSLKALQNEEHHGVTLRRIELHNVDWRNMSSDMQAALFDLMACGSLCQVRLQHVSNHPANLIDRLPPALKRLDISNTDVPLNIAIRRFLQLETLTIRFSVPGKTGNVSQNLAGVPTRLRSLELSTCNADLWTACRAVIQYASTSLEELYIVINITAEDFSFVDLSQFPRIRKVIIITPRLRSWLMCLASFRAAVVWLSQSLRNVSPENNITEVNIRFCIAITHGNVWNAPQFGAGIEKTAWESLDETLSQSSLASSKTFRGINLQFCTDINDIYEFLNGLVRVNLPKTESLQRLHVTGERVSVYSAAW